MEENSAYCNLRTLIQFQIGGKDIVVEQNKTKQKNPAISVIAKSVIGLLLRKITVIMAVVDTSSPGKKHISYEYLSHCYQLSGNAQDRDE